MIALGLGKSTVVLSLLLIGMLSILVGSPGADEGQKVFASKGCVACHGENAEGKVGPALAGRTEAEVVKTVRSGKGVMPPFASATLSDADLNAIVGFVEDLRAPAPATQAVPAPAVPPQAGSPFSATLLVVTLLVGGVGGALLGLGVTLHCRLK